MLGKNLIQAAAGAGAADEAAYVEDVFSTYLYTGNGTTNTITNGIDLAGEGGLVWIKHRSSVADHFLFDTARGARIHLNSNNTAAGQTAVGNTDLYQYNSDGFTLGADYWGGVNNSSAPFASWTFRKAKKFFDVVTYTGTGSNQTVSHNLGSVPGCIIVKAANDTASWMIYHKSLPSASNNWLQFTTAAAGGPAAQDQWGPPTATTFKATTFFGLATFGWTYVAYLFADDAGGFGDDGTESVIKCGSYTGNGSATGPVIDLGWEPQWLMVKRASGGTGGWFIFDNMRGITTGSADATLQAESNNAENTADDRISLTATGFQVTTTSSFFNNSSDTYVYIAIRRGPMKTPEDATTVFDVKLHSGNGGSPQLIPSTGTTFPIDLLISALRSQGDGSKYFVSRLTDKYSLTSTSTAAEAFGPGNPIATISGYQNQVLIGAAGDINGSSYSLVDYYFRRAPGFFDVMTYTGVGNNVAIPHNLGVAPQMIIVKNRGRAGYPFVVWTAFTGTSGAALNGTGTFSYANMSPTVTASSITYGGIGYEFDFGSSDNYIAYLFATCPGVSKVGSYTGTGTTLNIDCGFTAGARFVLIKRTNSSGDWYVWDTARGIVSGNDPYLLLNSTAAEVTSTDYIDPLSSGFQISSTAPADINANGGSFVYLAIA